MYNGDDCDDDVDDPGPAHQGDVCLPAGVQQGGGDGADVAIGGHVEHFLLKYIECLNILVFRFHHVSWNLVRVSQPFLGEIPRLMSLSRIARLGSILAFQNHLLSGWEWRITYHKISA